MKKYNYRMKNNKTEIALENKKIKSIFQASLSELESRFLKSDNKHKAGLNFQRDYTALVDKTIAAVARVRCGGNQKADAPPAAIPAIIALGGYGRGELAPCSDIDIVFVHKSPLNKQTEQCIEKLTGDLWNAGLKISASTRSLEDCAEAMDTDVGFLTALLEMRHVSGPKPVFAALEKSFRAHIGKTRPGWFVAAKLDERDLRHHKMGDSRYHLQPDVKEGKGALRDIHTLLWLANFLYGARDAKALAKKRILTSAEAKELAAARRFFWTVRTHLHFLGRRENDRLSFESQPEIALRMGYKDKEPNVRAEKFMKGYFLRARAVGHLTRTLCAKMEAEALKGEKLVLDDAIEGFSVKNNRLTVASASVFKKRPAEIARLFAVSQASGIDIHPDALRCVQPALPVLKKRRAEALPHLLAVLLEPLRCAQTLRHMNEADVLSALIPAFRNIVAHMQYDMYHAFTADEHTLHAVGVLHDIENGARAQEAPLATELFPKIHRRRALYAAMLLHDVAKGTGEDHSAAGAAIVHETAPLLGLDAEETALAAWLVGHHLAMTLTAFKRDLDDPKTIADFVATVQSPERLKLLTLLTTADIIAVGPGRWNAWKAGLLDELYHKTMDAMSDAAPSAAQKNPPAAGKTVIKITPLPEHDHTEVRIAAPDRKGLFSLLAGAMAAAGASIAEARIFTFSNGMAEDVFRIQTHEGRAVENIGFLEKTIRAALDGRLDLSGELRERRKAAPRKSASFKMPPQVVIDNDASDSDTVVEVSGHDRPGFLHALTATLLDQGLQISAAKIATFGSRAVDVLYVRDGFGLKILHKGKLDAVKAALKDALENGL